MIRKFEETHPQKNVSEAKGKRQPKNLAEYEKQNSTLEKKVKQLEEELKYLKVKENKYIFEDKAMTQKYLLCKSYENDLKVLTNQLALSKKEIELLKEDFRNLESKTIKMNHFRKIMYENLQDLIKFLIPNKQTENNELRKLIFNAAAPRTFRALLLKVEDSYRSPLEEITMQINVYLNEVSTIKEQ